MDPKLKFGSMDSNLEIRIRNDLLLTSCWSVSVSLQKLFLTSAIFANQNICFRWSLKTIWRQLYRETQPT